jgi:hypothetical protein
MLRPSIAALAAIAVSLAAPTARAHVIWIETAPAAVPARSQRVEVFFGEPHESLREESGGRLDQHSDLQVAVQDPGGRSRPLDRKKEVNCFAASFTPRALGRHAIVATSLRHPVQPGSGGAPAAKPMYYARAHVLSFTRGRVSEREAVAGEPSTLDILPVTRALDPVRGSIAHRAGGEVAVRVVFQGKPLAGVRVTAIAPNGWLRELPVTDAWGVTSVVALWPGRYVLDVSHEETSRGTFGGVPYDVLRHRATLTFTVDDAS